MPTIIFTADPDLPRDIKHLGYKKGDIVTMADDSCRRWIRRNVAEYVKEEVQPEPVGEHAVAALDMVDPVPDFDPETADVDALRAFITAKGGTYHPRAGEIRLREIATELNAD